jgi:peptide subunit release factor RF-3
MIRAVTEHWRGLAITSAALQFEYGDHMISPLDTPATSVGS